jgi:hypothetical protein
MTTLASSNLSAGSYTPEERFAGDADVLTVPATIATAAGALAAGSVLGRITASGKLVLCNNGAADGSQTPVAILCEDADATGGDIVVPVYVAGEFDLSFLVWHASFDTDAEKLAAFGNGLSGSIVVRKAGYSGG